MVNFEKILWKNLSGLLLF